MALVYKRQLIKRSYLVGNVSVIAFAEPITTRQGKKKKGLRQGCFASCVLIIWKLLHQDGDCTEFTEKIVHRGLLLIGGGKRNHLRLSSLKLNMDIGQMVTRA